MKFSTGFFDRLFGKKTMLQVPQDDGTMREVPVTEAWLKKMQAEGKISMSEAPTDTVPFYVIGPDGAETRHLQVGKDIPEAHYKKLADPQTGALYGLTVYENGAQKTNVIPKHIWEQAKTQFAEIDRAGEEFMQKTLDKFKNL
jgi:hypothetical protein